MFVPRVTRDLHTSSPSPDVVHSLHFPFLFFLSFPLSRDPLLNQKWSRGSNTETRPLTDYLISIFFLHICRYFSGTDKRSESTLSCWKIQAYRSKRTRTSDFFKITRAFRYYKHYITHHYQEEQCVYRKKNHSLCNWIENREKSNNVKWYLSYRNREHLCEVFPFLQPNSSWSLFLPRTKEYILHSSKC